MKFNDGFERIHVLYPLVLLAAWLAAAASCVKKTLYRLVGVRPRFNSPFFDGSGGPQCRAAKEGAMGWRAMRAVYNGPFVHPADRFWLLGMRNPMGTRNRLRTVSRLLSAEIDRVLAEKGSVTIVSLACGSAEAVVRATAALGEKKSLVKLVVLDVADDALEYVRGECARAGVEVTTVKANILRLAAAVKSGRRPAGLAPITDLLGQVDIVEMVGLLDYLKDEQALPVFAAVRELLVPGGLFVTANAMPNPEIPFLHWCSDWDMVYRRWDQLEALCAKVFVAEACPEPARAQVVAVCRKS